MHADREEGQAGLSAEDGAGQRAHHGNLPAHGAGQEHPRRRPAPRYSDGRLRRAGPDAAAVAAAALSLGGGGRGRHPRDQRRHGAARTLPADLAVHARAAACRRKPRSFRRSTVRWSTEYLSHEQDARRRHHHRRRRRRPDRRRSAPTISSAAMAAPARCARRLGIKLRGEANLLALRQALYRCDELFDKTADRQRARPRPPLSRGRRQGELPHHAGLDQALDAARAPSKPTTR